MKMNETELERFLEKTKRNEITGCLEWTACLDDDGYGRFWFRGRNALAHRVGYEHFIGPFPLDRPEADHLCQNERCVDYTHLEPVTGTKTNAVK